ncbi:hypothetical protein [Usitatibacter palustris]|uniref:Uncharacterized protein n=1 Tax=Usitatibacter palustris TaxID=2732487 RepID=A0A6M4H6S1_9PROT|nr:hypothetical protein [Usitatibacter palustris]QJR14885.1 hypothetical protein DSM104440_01700 [Usitatibacter palustris]
MNAAPSLADCVAALEARRRALCEEMHDYGTPVPACDADFNAMVAERAEISAALTRLAPLARGEVHVPHPREDH